MKHFTEILEDIKNTGAEIEKLEAEETRMYDELDSIDDLRERHAKRLSLMDRISETVERIMNLKIARELMKNNACVALYHDVLPVVLEVLQKYSGKPYGEKTEKKIADTIHEKTGCRAYIRSRYGNDEICIYPDVFGNTYNITCGPHPNADREKQEHLLNGNKINPLPFESFSLWYIPTNYIDDIPAAVEELKRLRAAAVEKQKELATICSAYNSIARGSMEHIYKDKAIFDRFTL